MDPDATYERWRWAAGTGNIQEAEDAHWDLREWLVNGGFEPRWTKQQRRTFFNWKAPVVEYEDENPSTDAEHLRNTCLVVGGLALVGGVLYLLFRSPSTTVAAPSPGIIGPTINTPLPANQPTGPQGS